MSEEAKYVLELLASSVSPVDSIRNEASNRILELELNVTFLATLLDIATSGEDDLSKLANIVLKNAICKIYSLSKKNEGGAAAGCSSLVNTLKERFVSILALKYDTRAVVPKDVCILVRRICRHEFPLNWPELYNKIVADFEALMKDHNELKLLNIVLLVHHIFKERLSMRLFKDRAVTVNLTEQLFPYLSKFWAMQFFSTWSPLGSNPDTFRTLSEVHLRTSLYLDTLLLNLYAYALKHVHKNQALLELFVNLLVKFKVMISLNRMGVDKTGLLRKNILRVVRGVGVVVERQPYTLVFLDLGLFLNEIFDVMVQGGWEDFETESIKLLTLVFSSNSMNNEKYSTLYFDQIGSVPSVQTQVAPILSPSAAKSLDLNKVVYYDSYDNMLASNQGINQSEIEDMMDRQLTFCLYKVLALRGGFVNFLDMLRSRYLKLSASALEEWSEDAFPVDAPAVNMVPELISCMNIKLVEIFNFVFNALVNLDATDVFEYDTFLQLYTLCFKDFYNFHSYKHFSSLLETFSKLSDLKMEESKLLVFRTSRVLNLWCKKPHLQPETKAEILAYLVRCVSSIKSEELKVQHLVPLSNLYKNTKDENIWPELFARFKTDFLIHHLSVIVQTNVPVIRTRSLELICNLCLEFEEDGRNLESILALYNQIQSSQICEAVLNTILDFMANLDWVKCYTQEDTLNPNFVLFVSSIINNTVETGPSGAPAIVALTKYPVINELFLALWVSFLRVIPLHFSNLDLMSRLFYRFGPFLDYVSSLENLSEPTLHNTLSLELLTEYMLLLGTYLELNKEYTTENVGSDVVFKSCLTTFSLRKLYHTCTQTATDSAKLPLAVYHTFGVDPLFSAQFYSVVSTFFDSLEACVSHADQNTHFGALSLSERSVELQPMRLNRDSLSKVEQLLPLLNKIAFSTQVFQTYVQQKNTQLLERWLNERLLTLVVLANLLRNDVYKQFGCIMLVCFMVSALPLSVYPFLQVTKKSNTFNHFDLGWDSLNIHESHPGIFLMCYLLRVLSNMCDNYKLKYLVISNEEVEGHSVPPSNRFEYVKNKSMTNSTVLDQATMFQDALAIAIKSIVEATHTLPSGYKNLLFAEIPELNSQVGGIVKNL